MVLATSTTADAALNTRRTDRVEDGQSAALVEIAVLDNLVNRHAFTQLRNSKQLQVGKHLLHGDTANVVPSLAIAASATLDGKSYVIPCVICKILEQFITSMA